MERVIDSCFEDRLARIFQATGAKTDSALARALDIQPQSVSAAKKRRQIPGSWVEVVAGRFDVSADWLLFGSGGVSKARTRSSGHGHILMDTAVEQRLNDQEEQIRLLRRELAACEKEILTAYREVAKLAAALRTLTVPDAPQPPPAEQIPAAGYANAPYSGGKKNMP